MNLIKIDTMIIIWYNKQVYVGDEHTNIAAYEFNF